MFWRAINCLILCAVGEAALPPEALSILASLPEKRLSLIAVWTQAIRVSDSYKSLRSLELGARALEHQALAPTDARAFAKAGYSDDRSEGTSPLAATQTRGSRYTLGVETRLSSGTTLSFDATHSLVEAKNTSFIGDLNYAESRLSLNVQQSLLRNSLGSSTRSHRDAQMGAAKSQLFALDESREDWALQIAEIFYGAWLSQQKLMLANEAVSRRERLLKVVEIRQQRGTSDKPDVLQVRSALERNRIQRAQARQELGDRWRSLVTMLKLPPILWELDPSEIPISVEQDVKYASARCSTATNIPSETAETRRYEEAKMSAELAVATAQSESKPDLDLMVSIGTNSVAPNSGSTVSDLQSAKYPAYSAGLVFSVPIGNHANQARVHSATADLIRAESQWNQAKDILRTRWQNGCLELRRLIDAEHAFKQTLEWQTERESLEESRFNYGRTSAFQVIQAADDRAETAMQLRAAQVQLYLSALAIDRLTGELVKRIKTLSS